jgi:xanthine dehydrogenase accessory factor
MERPAAEIWLHSSYYMILAGLANEFYYVTQFLRMCRLWFSLSDTVLQFRDKKGRILHMQTMDYEVLQHLNAWIEEGLGSWLCTIVETFGSSPRPVGSIVAITDHGRQIGSVSGGCVEEDLLEKLRNGVYSGERPELIEYGVTAEENERLGLPCGGRIMLLLQRVDDADKFWIEDVLTSLDERRCIRRELDLTRGITSTIPVEYFGTLEINKHHLHQCFGPRMRLLLVGAGQLASNLAELSLAMDYEVIVTDPRAQMLSQWEGPEVTLLAGMPDDVIREHASDPHSIIVTLTHDPRIDDMALMEALTTEACYVGALGSQRTTQKRLQRLRLLDLTEDQIGRLHAPVGLDIGSKTPIEIAVSIMAELTQLRRSFLAS